MPPPTSLTVVSVQKLPYKRVVAGYPNEGSLTQFLVLLFFPGVGARVMVGLLGRRLSVALLLCWNISSLVCSRITFLSKLLLLLLSCCRNKMLFFKEQNVRKMPSGFFSNDFNTLGSSVEN